jgi:hypothetical protein
MYNKSHHKQDGFFPFSGSHSHNGQGSLNEVLNTYNHLISSSCLYFITSFSYSILFYNVNNSFKAFHKYQKYFRFI